MAMQRRVSLFIATSLDGYIADSNGGISFLDLVKADGEDYGYSDFFNTTDTVVLGRKTWDTLQLWELRILMQTERYLLSPVPKQENQER